MSIKTNELQQLQSILGTDSLLADTAAAGTGRLSLARAAEFFGAELVKPANPVGAALSNKAELWAQNIAINWYLGNPINQRGKKIYSDIGNDAFCIDMWSGMNAPTVKLKDDCISFTQGADWSYIKNAAEVSFKTGDTVTFSWLLRNSQNVSGSYILSVFLYDGGINASHMKYEHTFNIALAPGETKLFSHTVICTNAANYYAMQLGVTTPAQPEPEVDLLAIKVEFGSEQTLARQDASGNWVLNDPPPDPALELLRCQRYYWRSMDFLVTTAADAWRIPVDLPFPGPMRIRPAVTVWSIFGEGTLANYATGQLPASTGIIADFDQRGVRGLGKDEGGSFLSCISSGWIEADAELYLELEEDNNDTEI